MSIAQDTYIIPDDIATGLATGIYRRIGSVVRHAVGPNKGQIVAHLKPVDIDAAEQVVGAGEKLIGFAKEHKKGTAIAFVATAVMGTGLVVYNKVKAHEPKVVTEFREYLRVYIEAIRKGEMDIETINALMEKLEELKKHKNYDKIYIQLTTDELDVLVGRIYDYTIKLANDNQVEFDEDELTVDNEGDVIINLQTYLKAQKKVFEVAA